MKDLKFAISCLGPAYANNAPKFPDDPKLRIQAVRSFYAKRHRQ